MFASFREWVGARLPKSRVARSIITLASGTALAQIIAICSMPIVTRLYVPAQIGVISLFLAFYSFWSATLSLRYEYALLIARDDAESHIVHRLAIMLVVGMSLLSVPVLWALHRTNLLGFGLLPGWAAYVAVPILLGNGIFMVYRSWALRAGMIRAITGATVTRSAANAGMRIVLGLGALGVPALFAAQFVGSWAALLKLASKVTRHFVPSRPRRVNGRDLLHAARVFVKFPVFEAPSAWINQLGLSLPMFIIATLHGAAAAGWFGLARMMVGVPNSQIGSAVADVLLMELANAVRAGDINRARNLFYKLLRKLALIGLAPMIGIAAFGFWLVPWVFGSKWGEAGLAAAGITPWFYLALVVSPLSQVLTVLQLQQYQLIQDISALLLLGAAFAISKIWDFPFMATVLAITVAGLLRYAVYAVVLIAVVECRLRRPISC